MIGRRPIHASRRDRVDPAPHLGPLPQFADGHERQPHAATDDVSVHPRWRALLLENRRDVGVEYDVEHERSGQRGVARRAEIGEECFELLIGFPHPRGELLRVADLLGMLLAREIGDRQSPAGTRLGMLRLAHTTSVAGARRSLPLKRMAE